MTLFSVSESSISTNDVEKITSSHFICSGLDCMSTLFSSSTSSVSYSSVPSRLSSILRPCHGALGMVELGTDLFGMPQKTVYDKDTSPVEHGVLLQLHHGGHDNLLSGLLLHHELFDHGVFTSLLHFSPDPLVGSFLWFLFQHFSMTKGSYVLAVPTWQCCRHCDTWCTSGAQHVHQLPDNDWSNLGSHRTM